ncbi:MAG: Sulfatase [Chthoniobacteraceae bacterium]|nr:Sulfatase [Chthoniobacteraceae bacterium]
MHTHVSQPQTIFTPIRFSVRKTAAARSSFWPAFWLGVALFGTKVYRVFTPGYLGWEEFERYILEVCMVAAADVLFALVAGLLGQALFMAIGNRPRLQTIAYNLFVVFCTACVIYAVLSMGLYDVLHMPLTYPLLCIGADIGNMRSSVTAALTKEFLATLFALPALFLVFTFGCARAFPCKRTPFIRAGQAAGILIILASCATAHVRIRSEWGQRYHMPKIWDNPHYDLISSWITDLFHRDTGALRRDYPSEFATDFLPSQSAVPITQGVARGPKNVIVIVCESVGSYYLSLYGSHLKTWPCMEAEAAHSLVFDHYYSHIENTSDALFAITLSRYAPLTWRNATATHPREPGATVAEILKNHDYRTAFISGGDNKYAMQADFLNGRGFDLIQDCHSANTPSAFSWGLDDKSTVDMILEFADRDRSKPFYVLSWTQATHHPFYVPPAYAENDFIQNDTALTDIPEDLNNYLNALAELDRQLGRLFQALRERHLADDTIVIVTGDHGQAFGPPHQGYFHSGNVYEEDVHAPFLIWSPSLFSNSPRSDAIGAHIDLAPTVLDLLGIAAPPGWQGRSLLKTGDRRAYFFGMRNDFIFGVREGRFKYIFNSTQGRDELYDLAADPREQLNLSPNEPALRERLHQRLAAWMESQKSSTREAGAVAKQMRPVKKPDRS